MREVTGVEMATDTEVYQERLGGAITIVFDMVDVGGWMVLCDDEEVAYEDSKQDALDVAEKYIVDDDLIVTGYGTHSGRKFWQLPESIKSEIIKIGRNA